MDVIRAVKNRRSVKHYDPQHSIPEDEVRAIFELALHSPTAFNIQNWRFVRVTDTLLRNEIRQVAWDQAQVTDASLLLVLCADLKSWEKSPARYWRNAPENVQKIMLPAIDGYYRDKELTQRDEAMRSCGIAAQTMMLAAQAYGYDSCPMDGFDFEQVGKLINLPEDHVISMMLAIGKGIQPAREKGGQLSAEEVIIENKFT